MAQASKVNGTLELVVLEAENLKKKDFNKMDPYCVIEFKNVTIKTHVCKKGHQNPTWEETVEMPIRDQNLTEKICFMVYDKELIKDNKIGRAEITLQELANCCKAEKTCNIELDTFGFIDKDKPAGTLKVKPCFSGSGWPGCEKSTAKAEEKSLAAIGSVPHEPAMKGGDLEHGGTGDDLKHGGTGDDLKHGGTGDDLKHGGTGEKHHEGRGTGEKHHESRGTGEKHEGRGTGEKHHEGRGTGEKHHEGRGTGEKHHEGRGNGEKHEGGAEKHHEGGAEKHHESGAEKHHEGGAVKHHEGGAEKHHEGGAEKHHEGGAEKHHEGGAEKHHEGGAEKHHEGGHPHGRHGHHGGGHHGHHKGGEHQLGGGPGKYHGEKLPTIEEQRPASEKSTQKKEEIAEEVENVPTSKLPTSEELRLASEKSTQKQQEIAEQVADIHATTNFQKQAEVAERFVQQNFAPECVIHSRPATTGKEVMRQQEAGSQESYKKTATGDE